MCGFGVSELQFELVVLMGLPNCTVGRETMTTTRESHFFSSHKKKEEEYDMTRNFKRTLFC